MVSLSQIFKKIHTAVFNFFKFLVWLRRLSSVAFHVLLKLLCIYSKWVKSNRTLSILTCINYISKTVSLIFTRKLLFKVYSFSHYGFSDGFQIFRGGASILNWFSVTTPAFWSSLGETCLLLPETRFYLTITQGSSKIRLLIIENST